VKTKRRISYQKAWEPLISTNFTFEELRMLSTAHTTQRRNVLVTKSVRFCGRKRPWPNWKNYPGDFLGGSEKSQEQPESGKLVSGSIK
jgi:hypothetical protein